MAEAKDFSGSPLQDRAGRVYQEPLQDTSLNSPTNSIGVTTSIDFEGRLSSPGEFSSGRLSPAVGSPSHGGSRPLTPSRLTGASVTGQRASRDAALLGAMRRQMEAFERKISEQIAGIHHSTDHRLERALQPLMDKVAMSEASQSRFDWRLAEVTGSCRGISEEVQSQIRRIDTVDGRIREWRAGLEGDIKQRCSGLERNLQTLTSTVSVLTASAADDKKHGQQRLARFEQLVEEAKESLKTIGLRVDAVEQASPSGRWTPRQANTLGQQFEAHLEEAVQQVTKSAERIALVEEWRTAIDARLEQVEQTPASLRSIMDRVATLEVKERDSAAESRAAKAEGAALQALESLAQVTQRQNFLEEGRRHWDEQPERAAQREKEILARVRALEERRSGSDGESEPQSAMRESPDRSRMLEERIVTLESWRQASVGQLEQARGALEATALVLRVTALEGSLEELRLRCQEAAAGKQAVASDPRIQDALARISTLEEFGRDRHSSLEDRWTKLSDEVGEKLVGVLSVLERCKVLDDQVQDLRALSQVDPSPDSMSANQLPPPPAMSMSRSPSTFSEDSNISRASVRFTLPNGQRKGSKEEAKPFSRQRTPLGRALETVEDCGEELEKENSRRSLASLASRREESEAWLAKERIAEARERSAWSWRRLDPFVWVLAVSASVVPGQALRADAP